MPILGWSYLASSAICQHICLHFLDFARITLSLLGRLGRSGESAALPANVCSCRIMELHSKQQLGEKNWE